MHYYAISLFIKRYDQLTEIRNHLSVPTDEYDSEKTTSLNEKFH